MERVLRDSSNLDNYPSHQQFVIPNKVKDLAFRASRISQRCLQGHTDILKTMPASSLRFGFLATFAFGTLLFVSGCRHSDPFNTSGYASSWNSSKSAAREELTQIPVPSKHAYLAVDQESQWQNPFLTIETNMIQIRIYLADENSSQVDRGGMTRLKAARKHVLNVRLKDLPRALSALPDGAWPYGRIVAVGEELQTPQNRTRLRGNLAVTVGALKDMDVIVDDWTSGPPMR